ncbi:MAG: hypothetical protein PHP26_10700 [Syntrophomonas sp.]|uniref:hypothetical protein n=1 Tax=Syntrophomonas sp. TaxID=2053627 RepID=UPI00262050A1|nr:hypothetical protein [Syntrophomonas sp.]MDD2511192.1 hypothetical protein [Syntrophomonas sp.]MDD3880434.1 hypothetical protein [Syntrophomonas sp.]MDD4627561.1 hypothetical protein [Syntrophomonas sp.]
MLDLDFAFFSLKNQDRRGLIYRKSILDRLAPLFFPPRVEKLIYLDGLNSRGCNISLPLGPGNLRLLDVEKQENISLRSAEILEAYQLPAMAVDRLHKEQLRPLFPSLPLVFGDNFIKALASVFVREILSRRGIRKLIITGETEYFSEFIAETAALGVPVSLQSTHPTRYEVLAYHLLYEKGQAVSTSYLKPANWERGELVLMFDPDRRQMAISSPRAFCIKFSDQVKGLSREMETHLAGNGIDPALHNLAPILEISLLAKAGLLGCSAEQNNAREEEGRKFLLLQELGKQTGLWELFLDKAI